MKLSSKVDSLIASLPKARPSWFDKLKEADQTDLVAIKKRFKSGGYGRTSKISLARAIMVAAREKGMSTCGEKGIAEWLSAD